MIVGYEIQAHLEGQWRPIGLVAETTIGAVTVVTKTSYSDPTDMDPADTQLYQVRAVNGTENSMPRPPVPESRRLTMMTRLKNGSRLPGRPRRLWHRGR